MLYVDADQPPAVKLYVDLGFVIDHIDQAYVGDIRASERGPTWCRAPYDLSRDDAGRARCWPSEPAYRVDRCGGACYDGPAPGRDDRPAPRRCATGWTPPCRRPAERDRVGSDDGKTVKWLWALADGARVETVLMHYPDRATVCVSSQAGCAMGCTFCATGQAGFTRHLTAGEIVEQVVAARPGGRRPTGCRTWCSWAWASRWPTTTGVWAAIDGSTTTSASRPATSPSRPSGWCPGSGAWPTSGSRSTWRCRCTPPTTSLRDRLVPLNRRYPLARAGRGLPPVHHGQRAGASASSGRSSPASTTGRRRRRAGRLARPLGAHVNLIPLNPTPGYPVRGTPPGGVRRFATGWRALGVNATVRRNRGTEIDAACGQLAGRGPDRGVTPYR